MELRLDGWGAERGQIRLVGEDLSVRNHLESRVVEIQPRWYLPVCDDIYIAHPRSILGDGTQRILQLRVVLKAAC